MSLRSPLGRVLGSGSAKDGTAHWWAQRMTAIALVILGLWFLFSLLQLPELRFQQVSNWIARPFNSVMLVLLSITLTYHSSLGVQVVIEDYVHGPLIKVLSLIMSKFFHLFLAAASVVAILRIALGTYA